VVRAARVAVGGRRQQDHPQGVRVQDGQRVHGGLRRPVSQHLERGQPLGLSGVDPQRAMRRMIKQANSLGLTIRFEPIEVA
jgi:hypothetical protein